MILQLFHGGDTWSSPLPCFFRVDSSPIGRRCCDSSDCTQALRASRRLRPARAERRLEMDLLTHPLSLSSSPPTGMWPGSYWWRGVRRQRPGPEVRRFRRRRCFRLATPVVLRLVNQTCPQGFTAGEGRCNVRACLCVCVCTHASMRMSFIFLWLPQPYNMSRDYPTFSFLITAPLYHSLSLASPDVLLHKLAEALTDIFCSNPSQSLPKARSLFFF